MEGRGTACSRLFGTTSGSRLVETREADVVRDRHLAYYVALTRRISSTLSGPDMGDALAVLECELDNLRMAIDWSAESDHSDTGLRLVVASLPFWNSQHRSEGLRRAREVLDAPAVPAQLRVRGLVGVAWMAWAVGELPAFREYAEEALAIARATEEEHLLGGVLPTAGWAAMWNLDDTATAFFEEAVPLLQTPGDAWHLADALSGLGAMAARSGDTARARRYGEEAVAVARRWGNPMSLGHALELLGSAVMFNGDFDEADAFLDEADRLLTAIGDHAAAAVTVYRGMDPNRPRRVRGGVAHHRRRAGVGEPKGHCPRDSVEPVRPVLDPATGRPSWRPGPRP